MSCKCQDKKKKPGCEATNPQDEVLFKDAYAKMNKDFIRARAQVVDLEQRLQTAELKAEQYLDTLSLQVHSLETYCSRAVQMMDPYTRNKFISSFGNPPSSPQIS